MPVSGYVTEEWPTIWPELSTWLAAPRRVNRTLHSIPQRMARAGIFANKLTTFKKVLTSSFTAPII